MADIIGLGSMVPVLMLAIDHSFLEKSSKLRWIFNSLHFQSEAVFLKSLILVILLFFILKSLMAFALLRYIRRTAGQIATELASESFNHTFETRNFYFQKEDGLGFNDKVIFTPYYFVSGIYIPFLTLLSEFSVVILLTLFFTIYKPFVFLLIVGLLGTGFFLVNRFTKRRITDLGQEAAAFRDQTLREINFGLPGFTDILMYNAFEKFRTKMILPFQQFAASGLKAINLQHVPGRINEMVALIGIVILVVYAYFYSSDNLGEVRVLAALFAIAVFRLVPAANRMLQSLMHLKLNAYTITKISEVINDKLHPERHSITFNNQIQLKNVSYSYPGNTAIFNQLNITIRKGGCIGIKGKSGSGKTTFAKLLLGLIQPDSGSIYIDEHVMNKSIRMNNIFSYVSQEPFIINGTIAENITFGEEPADSDNQRIEEALNLAMFEIESAKQEKHETIAGEGGNKLSEGQKQRLAIARAIYHNSEVLVLDEPTSALDAATEEKLIENLRKLNKEGKTIILISHKEKILEICDEVYELTDHDLKRI